MEKKVVTLNQVKELCAAMFPWGRNREGHFSGMAATIWESELTIILNQHYPSRNYMSFLLRRRVVLDPKLFMGLGNSRFIATEWYLGKALELVKTLLGNNDKSNAISAIKKIADGKFAVSNSKVSYARKLRIMAAARLMADQLHIPYSQEVFGVERFRLLGYNVTP